MSIVTVMLWFVFLGFFLFAIPASIYLFARFFPKVTRSYNGFAGDDARAWRNAKIER